MGLIKDTEYIILLLKGLNTQEVKVRDIYIGRIKETEEYKTVKKLDQYEYITNSAKKLKEQLTNIKLFEKWDNYEGKKGEGI